jgi:hypothetical protein
MSSICQAILVFLGIKGVSSKQQLSILLKFVENKASGVWENNIMEKR